MHDPEGPEDITTLQRIKFALHTPLSLTECK